MSSEAKTTIVWGASGGAGRAVTQILCQHGQHVIAYARDTSTLQGLASQYPTLELRTFEITENFYATEAKQLSEAGRHINGMVDCVGSITIHRDTSYSQRIMDIFRPNLLHPYYAVMHFRDVLQPGSSVVFISSIRALTGTDNANIEYSMAKAALENLTRSLMYTLKDQAIRVNCLRATPIADTNMSNTWPTEMANSLARQSVYGTLLSPGDIANAVLFLLSEQSRGITGSILDINNGFGLLKPQA